MLARGSITLLDTFHTPVSWGVREEFEKIDNSRLLLAPIASTLWRYCLSSAGNTFWVSASRELEAWQQQTQTVHKLQPR